MKRILLLTTFVFFLVLVVRPSPVQANPSGVPYITYTMGTRRRLVPTQTAYVPVGILNANYPLNNPSDITVKGGYVVVANTGMKNVVVFNTNGTFVKTIGQGILAEPLGVFVDEQMNIYVADKEAGAVFKFDFEGTLLYTYSRPTQPLFGEQSVYRPEKVVVDRGGTLYVTGEGAVNGVMQINAEGIFRGYFAVNQTRFDWRMRFTDLFLGITDQLARNLPPAPTNLTIDNEGLVYTITSNIEPGIKKFNMLSVPIMTAGYTPDERLIGIDVDQYENVYVVDAAGVIYQYDAYGNLLFAFGGSDTGAQRLGLLNRPSGIAVDTIGALYVLDRGYNVIQIYAPTPIVTLIQEGNYLYDIGDFDGSLEVWQDVFNMNSNFRVANSALGRILFRQGEFDQSLEHFITAQDRHGYSETFWELRNRWLQAHAGTVILGVIGVVTVNTTLNVTKSKPKVKDKLRTWTRPVRQHPVMQELKMLFGILKNPADTFYQIKRERRGTYYVAIGLFIALFGMVLGSHGLTSFLFTRVELHRLNLLVEFAQVIGILMLFIVANHLVSTLTDGEGWFRDLFIGTIYACAPLILGLVPLAILSNILTYNEQFVYTFIEMILYAWTALLLFIMIKEIHNFKLGETIKNIIITFFAMMVLALLGFVVYMLVNQMMEFLFSLFKEVIIRVQN